MDVEIPQLGGHEQEGTRPAIILADTRSSIAIIIPCTSNLQATTFPYTFLLDHSKENGLIVTSVALILQIRAIDQKRLKKHIGNLEKGLMSSVDKMLKKLLAI